MSPAFALARFPYALVWGDIADEGGTDPVEESDVRPRSDKRALRHCVLGEGALDMSGARRQRPRGSTHIVPPVLLP
jgi:hypothetical protein